MLINTYELVGLEVALLEPLGVALQVGVRSEVTSEIILKQTTRIGIAIVIRRVHHWP